MMFGHAASRYARTKCNGAHNDSVAPDGATVILRPMKRMRSVAARHENSRIDITP